MSSPLHGVAETEPYLARCNRIGVSVELRDKFVDQVAREPSAGAVVVGSGGVRKVRFGGRGGYRLMVAYFDADTPAYLLSVLDKGQDVTFTDKQIKAMRKMTDDIKNERRTRRMSRM